MKIHNVAQGSQEWHVLRAESDTASEASAMTGASKKTKRNELLHMKATGSVKEFSDWVQKNLLDPGHSIEAAARPIAEAIIGEELFPCTATSDEHPRLLASFDGITMLEDVCWECKSWNEAKATEVREGRVPDEDHWQVVQQLVVSRAEKCLYMVTDGTKERTVHCWATLDPADEKRLLACWKQFNEDRAAYVPTEAKVEAVATTIMELPSLSVMLVGEVKQSNLAVYRESALTFIQAIKTDLQTDQDFADAEATVKFCDKAEKELESVKKQALAQTSTIDELFRTVDQLQAEMKAKRLMLDKLVKSRKETIKVEIKQKAEAAFAEHVAAINKRLGKVQLPAIHADFATAIKNKRTIASLQDAVDSELARVKIDANAAAEAIEVNLASLRELAADHAFLFSDAQQLVLKANDDLVMLIKSRISEHEAAEKVKAEAAAEAAREVIRKEEADKLRTEQAAEQARTEAQAVIERAQEAPEAAAQPTPDFEKPTVLKQSNTTASASGRVTPYSAEVTDLMALVKAVADGLAPLKLLQVNQAELDALVDDNDGRFAFPGVRLCKATA